MHYGLCVSNIGSHSDARAVAGLAGAAEEAGWEGLFIWDHLAFVWGMPSADPWVVLSACALATSRILLGTTVTPVPRRRVQNLAHTVSTLDRLSGGRVVFGAGLGGNRGEFERFGEDFGRVRRLELLDEGLDVLRRLWAGEVVEHEGLVVVRGVKLEPPPTGRVPIWIGGNSAEALARAARFDGWVADSVRPDRMTLSPGEVAAKAAALRGEVDVVVNGYAAEASVSEYEAAGATWWLENLHDLRGSPDEILSLVRQGPPA
jgi:alkanesulfonate monooxygenase SsuD/methylene tetrahydromethanopterin reductase-like flavin-dependent oxidoreductase (luciferase family)